MQTREGRVERARIWGALTLVSLLVLAVAWGISKEIAGSIQSQRRSATIISCNKQNTKHSKLFGQLHAQRVATGRLPMGAKRREQELQSDSREELIATLEPWEDCVARARLFVK